MQSEKLSCLLEDEKEEPVKAEVYYCTSEGKVYGELTVKKHRVFFEPFETKENGHLIKQEQPRRKSFIDIFKKQEPPKEAPHMKQLKRFEVCIDIGDVVSC